MPRLTSAILRRSPTGPRLPCGPTPPALSCVNGTPVLAWAESAVTDEESVVNPASESIYTAGYTGSTWTVAQKAADAAAVTNRGLEPASGSVLFTGPDGALLAERTFQNLTYGGTVIAEFEPESFSDLYGEDVTATVTLQQDEPNTLNNTDSVPILLTATEILSAQRGGSSVTAEIVCMHDSARALCAFYDATGRLLRTVIQPLESGKINSLTFRIDSNAAQAKLFVLDAKNAPAAPARSIPLNS